MEIVLGLLKGICILIALYGFATIIFLYHDIKSDKMLLYYKMCLDNKFVVHLASKLERKGIEFCLKHSIPIHYLIENSPDITYAGQIRYRYNRITKDHFDFEIVINYKALSDAIKSNELDMSLRIEQVSRTATIFHEIGHYLEVTNIGNTTEIGADLQGNKLMASYCDDVMFKFLALSSSLFKLKENELVDEDLVNNKIQFDELKYIYSEYKRNVA